jgi:hypothetical protein
MNKILDKYYNFTFIIDILIILIIWLISKYCPFINIVVERSNLLEIISSIIDTSVALSGFILAALTIIITFKSSIKAKGFEKATSAFEMILSSKHYKDIVISFKNSLIELVVIFIALYWSWVYFTNIDSWYLLNIICSAISILSLAISRSLYLLFYIISTELKNY